MSDVSNNTLALAASDSTSGTALLDPAALDAATARATEEFLAEGTPANTARSYASAMRYWAAWYALRYGGSVHAQPMPVTVVNQFVIDHLARRVGAGLRHELPADVDAQLVALGAKKTLGPLSSATVGHRLAVLAKWHRLQQWESPTDDHRIKTLVAKARRAQAKRGVVTRKKTAAVAEPLQAMLDTCTDGLRGVRDRALLLLAWSGGGRRRSEVAGADMRYLRAVSDSAFIYTLVHSKTNQSGTDAPENHKPVTGRAASALKAWLNAAQITEGAIFRRIRKGGHVAEPLSPAAVRNIVKERCALAGVEGDFSAHSLRSGFVTEAGRQNVPLPDTMALTGHHSVNTVLGYYRADTALQNRAANLLDAEVPSKKQAAE